MTHILSNNRFFVLGLFALLTFIVAFSLPTNAQERQKPKLALLQFNDKTNNDKHGTYRLMIKIKLAFLQ